MSMACETSPLPVQILQNGNHADHLSAQMLQRLSHLPSIPSSEYAITNLFDDSVLLQKSLLSPSIDQSSIYFPTTDVYHYDSSSSGSSGPSDESHIIIPRFRRVRGQNSPTASVSLPSSPTLLSIKSRHKPRIRSQGDIIKSAQHTPGLSDISDADSARPLHFSMQVPSSNAGSVKPNSLGAHPRQFSSEMRASSLPHMDSHVHAQSGKLNLSSQTRSIRKQSGEPIKPSLKRPKVPSLLIPISEQGVRSEPTTPTLSKVVHFDPKLEHVKLFLAKQKPLAVSRDHDQATDTSGTESDFPSFFRGSPNDSPAPEKHIELQIRNMPSFPPEGAEVILEGLTLSQSDKTIVGRVRVRNIAYEKWVATRFTLDLWQTTSEVTARYTESVNGGLFDIFTFSIRLHDMWTRIEDKTMSIALRYSAAGKQFWDNNNGANYMVKFVQKPVAQKTSTATELIVGDLSAKVGSASIDTDPLHMSPLLRPAQALPPKASPSARYHVGPTPGIPGSGSFPPLPPAGTRTTTYPTELSSVLSKHTPYRVGGIPPRHSRSVTIGSTRDLEQREQSHVVRSDSVGFESPPSAGGKRNPRRGYFDRPVVGTSRKHSPGSALSSLPEDRSPTRGTNPMKGLPSLFERFTTQSVTRVSSESSDASAISDLSSLSTPPTSPGPGTPDCDDKPSLNDSYSQFLNQ
jgi:hypothetical protein